MWESDVKVIDRFRDSVEVRAVHYTDGKVDWRYQCTAIITEPYQRTAVFTQIKNEYAAYKAKQLIEDAIISGLGDTLTNALNNWENE